MPFTHLQERQIKMLTQVFGPFTVYSPSRTVVPDVMQSWAQQKKLNIRYPQGVDEEQLRIAVENYKVWADFHKGDIRDMAAFLKTHKNRFPMTDETNPTHIGYQIRHFGQAQTPASDDSLFNAALFLCMAQEYDLYHQSMAYDMKTVDAMEKQMLRHLSGDLQDVASHIPSAGGQPSRTAETLTHHDPYMTSQRVQAWSQFVFQDTSLPSLYLTLNKNIVAYVLDLFPDIPESISQSPVPEGIREIVGSPAFDSRSSLFEAMSDLPEGSSKNGTQWTLYRLTGVSPVDFLARLAGRKALECQDVEGRYGNVPENTLLGWVTME